MDVHFLNLMRHLFQHMDIDMPRHQDNDEYAVSVDGEAKMRFFVAPAGYLNVVSVVAEASETNSPGMLLNLLKMNGFTPVLPDFNFKIGVDQTTNHIELWMREPLAGLEPARLIELFHLFLEAAGFAKTYIERAVVGNMPHHTTASFQMEEVALAL